MVLISIFNFEIATYCFENVILKYDLVISFEIIASINFE